MDTEKKIRIPPLSRRGFLKTAALAATGAVASQIGNEMLPTHLTSLFDIPHTSPEPLTEAEAINIYFTYQDRIHLPLEVWVEKKSALAFKLDGAFRLYFGYGLKECAPLLFDLIQDMALDPRISLPILARWVSKIESRGRMLKEKLTNIGQSTLSTAVDNTDTVTNKNHVVRDVITNNPLVQSAFINRGQRDWFYTVNKGLIATSTIGFFDKEVINYAYAVNALKKERPHIIEKIFSFPLLIRLQLLVEVDKEVLEYKKNNPGARHTPFDELFLQHAHKAETMIIQHEHEPFFGLALTLSIFKHHEIILKRRWSHLIDRPDLTIHEIAFLVFISQAGTDKYMPFAPESLDSAFNSRIQSFADPEVNIPLIEMVIQQEFPELADAQRYQPKSLDFRAVLKNPHIDSRYKDTSLHLIEDVEQTA